LVPSLGREKDLDRLIEVRQEALSLVTQFGYDAAGNVTSVGDPKGQTTTYGYDPLSRLTDVTQPLGQTVSYGYDAAGRLDTVTNARAHVLRYGYLPWGGLEKVEHFVDAQAARGQAAVGELFSHATSDSESSEWPGTRLLRHNARVIKLPATEEVVGVLLELADSLYSWRHPDLPEDVFFLRADGSPLMGSIAHEADAFLEISPDEESEIVGQVPELSAMMRLD